MVEFEKLSDGDLKKIIAISKRVKKFTKKLFPKEKFDEQGCMMDISAVHLKTPLDLDKLLNFEAFDLFHDISGINKHLNRETGKLKNCFSPRCSIN